MKFNRFYGSYNLSEFFFRREEQVSTVFPRQENRSNRIVQLSRESLEIARSS